MPTVSSEALLRFATGVLERLGASPEDAREVGHHLVDANLAGHDSHGVLRLIQYRDQVESGRIAPAARPEVVRDRGGTALVDGRSGWGPVAAALAVELAVTKAREHGAAAVAVRNAGHAGRAGVYPRRAAEQGLLAQLWCNVHGVARVAPWGGTEARLATNPVALAAPTSGAPLVVDITTSVVPEGKVRVAHVEGRPVPEGWVLDRDGRPTTDPARLYDGGTLLPLGGREGHKGYGLSVLVDVLGGCVSGAGCGLLADVPGNGLFLTAQDPEAFDGRAAYLERVDRYIEYLRSASPAPGTEEILLPGEPEDRLAAERRRAGIPVDEGTWSRLGALAGDLGVVLSS